MEGAKPRSWRGSVGRKAYARLRSLKALGWVSRRRKGVPGPGAFLATRQGLRGASLDLPEASYSPTSLGYDLAATAVARSLGPSRCA